MCSSRPASSTTSSTVSTLTLLGARRRTRSPRGQRFGRRGGPRRSWWISATGQRVRSSSTWRRRPCYAAVDLGSRQPSLAAIDFYTAVLATKRDPRWQEAIRARGIEDLAQVQVDPWPTGDFVADEHRGRRLARCLAFLRPHPADNGYARPFEGIIADRRSQRRHGGRGRGSRSRPPSPSTTATTTSRPPAGLPRPTSDRSAITQPEGPSFHVEGHHVTLAELGLRVAFAPDRRTALHQVGYHDGGELRSILYRASLAEMVVPYGDPAPPSLAERVRRRRGRARALRQRAELGLRLRRRDPLLRRRSRRPAAASRAATQRHLHARGGLRRPLEAHGPPHRHDPRSGGRGGWSSAPSTRSGTTSTGCFWYFYQDGTIQLEMKLTGIVATKAVVPGRAVAARGGDRPRTRGTAPPAPVLLPARRRRRRRRQHRLRGRRGADRRRRDQPVGQRLRGRADTDPHRGEARPPGRRIPRPHVACGQRAQPQLARPAGRLQARAPCVRDPARRPRLLGRPAGGLRDQAPVGDAERPDPAHGRPAASPTRAPTGPTASGAGSRPTARSRARDTVLWHTFGPTHIVTTRGLADHARGVRRIHAATGGVLRPEPLTRRPAHRGSPLSVVLERRRRMKLSMQLGYSSGFEEAASQVAALDRVGLDLVWVAEAYGLDAVSFMGYLPAQTEHIEIGAGILPLYTRTPTLLAMTAAGVDTLSDSRCVLGLGASGPQVIEGFHGVPYDKPLARTARSSRICRKVWARKEALSNAGSALPDPVAGVRGHGRGKAAQDDGSTECHPASRSILAALGLKNVKQTAAIRRRLAPSCSSCPNRRRPSSGRLLDAGDRRRTEQRAWGVWTSAPGG